MSVETIAETVHPESKQTPVRKKRFRRDVVGADIPSVLNTDLAGKVIQSAEAIVGDDTACILMNLKNGKFFGDDPKVTFSALSWAIHSLSEPD